MLVWSGLGSYLTKFQTSVRYPRKPCRKIITFSHYNDQDFNGVYQRISTSPGYHVLESTLRSDMLRIDKMLYAGMIKLYSEFEEMKQTENRVKLRIDPTKVTKFEVSCLCWFSCGNYCVNWISLLIGIGSEAARSQITKRYIPRNNRANSRAKEHAFITEFRFIVIS